MKAAEIFGMFDSVKLKESFDGIDIHDWEISLRKGKSGCVMDLGTEENTVIVEFRTGKGMKGIDFTQVELDAEILELESKVGRRFADPNPYYEKALAIKAASEKSERERRLRVRKNSCLFRHGQVCWPSLFCSGDCIQKCAKN